MTDYQIIAIMAAILKSDPSCRMTSDEAVTLARTIYEEAQSR